MTKLQIPAEGWYRTNVWCRGHRAWYLVDLDGRGETATLYTAAEWDSETPSDFGVDADGYITFLGERTGRTVADLIPCTEDEARQAEVA